MNKTVFCAALLTALSGSAWAQSSRAPAGEDCWSDARPFAERRAPRADAGDLIGPGTIVGALVGGAIGRQFGSSPGGKDRGAAAGAFIGAIIGHQIERDAQAHPEGRERDGRNRRPAERELCRA